VTFTVPPVDDLEQAWAELRDAREAVGWYVGRPAYDERRVVI
jgi:hypothetical protein